MKIILINIILLFSIVKSENLTISPLFYASYQPLGGTWNIEENDVLLGGWGIIGAYNNNNFDIEIDFYNNRIFGIQNKPNYFSKEQGLAWWRRVDSANNPNNNTYDFDVANIKMTYYSNNYEFFLGKFNRHWGPGESSLTISNKSPSFGQFGFNWNINSNIKFEYFHGALKSLIIDDLNSSYYNETGVKNSNLNRFIAAHRIDFKLLPSLRIGASEIVVYGVRNMDMMYNIPFIPFWSLQHYLGDLDNIQLSFDFDLKINKKINLYGAFLMDEWRPSVTFNKDKERNWFAYQLGARFENLFLNDDFIKIEYNWTDHRIYRHRFPINDYYNHGYPIGFWAGPHSEELFLNYTFEIFDFIFKVNYSNAKRGLLTEEMLDNQYHNESDFERYSDGYESISLLNFTINKYIYKGLELHLGLSAIDWKNGNFDPSQSNQTNLKNVNKNSYYLGISYNFDIQKQKSFINEEAIQLKYD
ncbi:MAG: hypothetical protein CMG21_01180 [Candidatus Marinimicrobia bacterium]|nr:hypothetical protein [Candidatus Neomarinimicrobiota bacterium]|tara:strand:- start:379 stop:1794 length:1416 start_codon:yes stop_codon:yes gene_type:complete